MQALCLCRRALGSNAGLAPSRRWLKTAIVGMPNVGKSTLFNSMLGHAAAEADKIALELTEDGRLHVRVEKPPAPPDPTQIPIERLVAEEKKLVEAPPKNAAELETELDSKFAVAPSPEAEATVTADIADAEKAEAEAAA